MTAVAAARRGDVWRGSVGRYGSLRASDPDEQPEPGMLHTEAADRDPGMAHPEPAAKSSITHAGNHGDPPLTDS